MAQSTNASDLSRRALPMELHEVILKFFLTDLSVDDPNKSFSRACSPSIVSKLFLEVPKPDQLKRISALSLNAHPNDNEEAQRTLQHFNDHPGDRELVKRIQLFIGAGCSLNPDQVRDCLENLWFQNVEALSLEYEETPDINADQVINLGLLPHYVRSAFTGIRFLELTKVAELYLPVFLRIPSIETLKLNGCLFCLTVELDPYEMPVADSNIRCFEFNGNIVPDGAHNQRNYVGLSTLLLLPRLEELVFNGLQRFCPLPSILGFEPALSFDLRKLVIHAEKEEEIRLLLELYHDQAALMSVRPFDRLHEFRVSADGKIGGDVPVEHILRVLEMTHLETFALSWGWTTSMTELWKIYDRLAMYITSRENMLKNLQLPVLAFPNFDAYDEAMAKLVGFLNSIAVSNTLEELRISFSTNVPSHPLLDLFQSFPLGPWHDVAELLKSSDNFPSLKSVVVDWTCLRQRNADEVMINSVDSLAHYHFRMATKPLAERPAVKSSLNWSTTFF